ncbi:MAG: PQQ-binding-like beta-propeller repeat protein [Nitriliruptorales bacterium]|nr:PQQ-binding-like beta-propeller repeat protein [Nitriliruptorales bacterium]
MATVVTCTSCGANTPGDARWCGSCGATLGGPAPAPEQPAVIRLDDPHHTGEVEEQAPPQHYRNAVLLLVGAVVLALLAVQAQDGSEAEPRGFTPRGDEARSGVVSLAPVGPPDGVVWRAPVTGGDGWNEHFSAIHGENVAVAGADGITLHTRDSGAVHWRRPDLQVGSSPVLLDEVLVAFDLREPPGIELPSALAARRGRVVALDLADGRTRWDYEVGFGRAEFLDHPAGLVVRDGNRAAALLDPATGTEVWRIDTLDAVNASLRGLLSAGTDGVVHLFVTRPAGIDPREVPPELVTEHAVGLDATTGGVLFEVTADPETLATHPLAVVGDVIVGVDATSLWTWDAATGARLGATPHQLGNPLRGVVDGGDVAVVVDQTGTVIGVDPASRTRVWGVNSPAGPDPQVTAAGDALLLRDGDRLTFASIDTGNLRGAIDLPPGAELSVPDEDGTYVVSSDGEIVLRSASGGTLSSWYAVTAPWPAPIVHDGAIGVVTARETALFDAATGEVRWRLGTSNDERSVAAGSVHAPVATSEVLVFSPPRSGSQADDGLAAIDLVQAVFRWDRSGDEPSPAGPLTLVDETVFLPVGDQIHGHSTLSGRRSFAARGGHARGPVAVHREYVFAATSPTVQARDPAVTPSLVAIRRTDRSQAWEVPVGPCTAPVVMGEMVALVTPGGISAHDVHRGERQWLAPLDRPACLDLAVAGDRLLAIDGDRTVVAVSATGEQVVWTRELTTTIVAAPTVAGDTLLAPLRDGTIVALDVTTGDVAWSAEVGATPASSVVVVDGRLVLLTRSGELVVLGS